jgi:4-hydroxybenzoate polyprenyltransferase
MNAHPTWTSVPAQPTRRPLCVDLDGTLLATDVLFESFVRYVKSNPLRVVTVAGWLMRGPAHVKAKLAAEVVLDPATLPVHAEVLTWLRAEKQAGRKLVLCTATNDAVARRIADHFGLFDEVIASTATDNLSGRAKARTLIERFGVKGFDYAGNERKDLHVWREAHAAIVVAPQKLIGKLAAEPIDIERTFALDAGESASAKHWLRALRLHQWTKNLLVFVPLAAAHRIDDLAALAAALFAFVLFGTCASGGYIVNDLLDLDADRAHARKRSRPFAAGVLSIRHGLFAAAALIGGSLALAALALPWMFAATLAGYLVTSLWYSLALKRIAMVDVLCLAALYSVRIIAGGAAVAIVPSFWLLAFSMFLFLSLAAAKRFAELQHVREAGRKDAPGRGYSVDDLPLLQSSGVGAGYVCVLVLALYVNSGAAGMYSNPRAMWLLCPLLLYWVNRVWLKTSRGQMHDDPVVFAVTDRPSWAVFMLSAVLVAIAS